MIGRQWQAALLPHLVPRCLLHSWENFLDRFRSIAPALE